MILTHGANSIKRSGDITSVEIGGKTYPVVKIGSLYWISESLDFSDANIAETPVMSQSVPNMYHNSVAGYGAYYNQRAVEYLTANESSLFPTGWRVAKKEDYQHILSLGYALNDFISENDGGTNISGFNARLSGLHSYSWESVGDIFNAWWGTTTNDFRGNFYISVPTSDIGVYDGWSEWVQRSIRLVKDVT